MDCTLAFVNSWLTKSTLPFVWDDPASPEDVSQLAIDLANGAVRGKATEEARTPLTACLVTANFDMQNVMKYFSRLFIVKVVAAKKEKQPGDAKVLEDHAKSASSALPALLHAVGAISADFVNQQTTELKLQLPGADLRILEGISYPLAVAKVMTSLCNRGDLMGDVEEYLEDILIPYYKRALGAMEPTSATRTKEVLDFNIEVVTATTATIVKGAELATRKDTLTKFLQCHDVVERVKDLGGRVNKTVRLDGRPTKCLLLPKSLFRDDIWQSFIRRIFDIAVDEEEENERSEEEDELAPHMVTFAEEVELPALMVPAAEESFGELPPPPPPADEDLDLFDISLPPPPPEAIEDDDDVMDLTLPPPPEEFLPQMQPALEVCRIANLMSAIPASPGNKCAKCRKVGRPGTLWIMCSTCSKWFHRACTTLSYSQFKQMNEDSVWQCHNC